MIRHYSDRGIDYKIHQSERERDREKHTERDRARTINKDYLGQC